MSIFPLERETIFRRARSAPTGAGGWEGCQPRAETHRLREGRNADQGLQLNELFISLRGLVLLVFVSPQCFKAQISKQNKFLHTRMLTFRKAKMGWLRTWYISLHRWNWGKEKIPQNSYIRQGTINNLLSL